MNSSGDITMWVVPSRQAVLSLSTTCPALLICTRSLASAGRVMVRHSCFSRWRSLASQRTAACCAVALLVGTQLLGPLDVQRHGALQGKHILPGARAKGNAGSSACQKTLCFKKFYLLKF